MAVVAILWWGIFNIVLKYASFHTKHVFQDGWLLILTSVAVQILICKKGISYLTIMKVTICYNLTIAIFVIPVL